MWEERVIKGVDWTHFSSDGSLRRTSGAIHWGYKEEKR